MSGLQVDKGPLLLQLLCGDQERTVALTITLWRSVKDCCSYNYFVEISKGLLLLELVCGDQ